MVCFSSWGRPVEEEKRTWRWKKKLSSVVPYSFHSVARQLSPTAFYWVIADTACRGIRPSATAGWFVVVRQGVERGYDDRSVCGWWWRCNCSLCAVLNCSILWEYICTYILYVGIYTYLVSICILRWSVHLSWGRRHRSFLLSSSHGKEGGCYWNATLTMTMDETAWFGIESGNVAMEPSIGQWWFNLLNPVIAGD